jgi:hypothetical protein
MRTIAAMIAAASGGTFCLGGVVMPNPWEVPPFPERGEEAPEPLYTAVGHALSTWELVEEELASLFALMVGQARRSPETQPAIRAYGAIVSFTSRADMLAAASKGFFLAWPNEATMTTFEEEFRELMKMASGWSGRRNDLAHGRVNTFTSIKGYCLAPGLYNSKKNTVGNKPSYIYTATHVATFQRQFEFLFSLLRDYWYRLLEARHPSLRRRLQQEYLRDNPPPPNP